MYSTGSFVCAVYCNHTNSNLHGDDMNDNHFKKFADKIEAKFNKMAQAGTLYQTDQSDAIWDAYLAAFPEGTNPIFIERTEHDCQCCRQFVRRVGSVVSIQNGKPVTIWNVKGLLAPYDTVAKQLHELMSGAKITSVFATSESKYGSRTTRSLSEDGQVLNWNHFEATVPAAYKTNDVGQRYGKSINNFKVLKRGLSELTTEALEIIVEIVQSDNTAIYRAAEHLPSLKGFLKLKKSYDKLKDERSKTLFAWANTDHKYALFRNTVIGTLIIDLSEGKTLEQAVGAFESKVAPHNYKRPKALITKGMVKQAMEKIEELGLRNSLERRHANIRDVSVNDILFVDRSVAPQMKDALLDSLMEEVVSSPVKGSKDAVEINADVFLESILPEVDAVEVLFENRLEPNLVSITAPVHDEEPSLFSWNNDFSWSYLGGAADSSIKTRVSKAGGNVSAPLRVSLAWENTDDLDIHVVEPNRNRIYYGNKGNSRSSTGFLDIDMNVSSPVRGAVENVCWKKPKDGLYQVEVNNYTKRESRDPGFELELESNGSLSNYSYTRVVGNKETIKALQFKVKDGSVVETKCGPGVTGGVQSRTVWGVDTEQYVKVQTMMFSPNHWHGEQKGNKHLFFILEGCSNDDTVRGMYNENLRSELNENRKVFEVLASKMMVEPADEQLSGLGFSQTQKNNVTLRVRGKINGTYNVQF